MQKIALVPLAIVASGIVFGLLIWFFPTEFGVPNDSINAATVIPSIFAAATGASYFAIQNSLTSRKEREEKRKNHFTRIREDVLMEWVKTTPALQGYYRGPVSDLTFMSVKIVDTLETAPRFAQLKSHLRAAEYKQLNDMYDSMKSRELAHNRRLDDFANSAVSRIAKAIYSTSGQCHIKPTDIAEWQNQKLTPNYYFMKQIIDNLYGAVYGNDQPYFTVDKGKDGSRLLNGERGNEIAYSDSFAIIECLKEKLDSIRPTLLAELTEIRNEKQALESLFKGDFMKEVKLLIIKIEDNGYMKGGCGLDFCPQKIMK